MGIQYSYLPRKVAQGTTAPSIRDQWSEDPLTVKKLLSALWKFDQNEEMKESPRKLKGCHYHRHKEGAKCSGGFLEMDGITDQIWPRVTEGTAAVY
jgi:hypothetical protein